MYYIYKITNKINNKFYIGKHKQSKGEDFNNYFGSGKIIKDAIKKYGKENFLKEIIEICTKDNVGAREIYWINKLNATNVGYNISIGGYGGNSTNGTKVYTNGKNKKYISSNDKIPENYYLGVPEFSKEQRINMSKSMIGKNKHNIPWNKGKTLNDKTVELNVKKAAETTRKTGILKGANNPRALTYIIVDPNNKKYTVTGRLKQFCKEHNISRTLLLSFLNKGKVYIRKNNTSKASVTLNSIGWEITKVASDSVKEAKQARRNTYKELYSKNLLSKRQSNINKIEAIDSK